MNLGSGFPEDFRLTQIRRRLKPGVVIKLFCDLMSRPEWILGDASADCCAAIMAGIKATETLSVAEVEKICAALTSSRGDDGP